MLFGLLVNHLASFQASQPALKPFSLASKQDHFTGQVCNRFATYIVEYGVVMFTEATKVDMYSNVLAFSF